MALRRLPSAYFVVGWYIRTYRKGKVHDVQRTKRFNVGDENAMTAFMASKMDTLGIRRVYLLRYNAQGIIVNRADGSRRPRRILEPKGNYLSGGCSPDIAATIEDEDFGSFAGLC